jgi:hypothetical protein
MNANQFQPKADILVSRIAPLTQETGMGGRRWQGDSPQQTSTSAPIAGNGVHPIPQSLMANQVPPQPVSTRPYPAWTNDATENEPDQFQQSDLPAWLGAVGLLLLSLAAGYLLWAKVSSAWPF